MRTRQTAVSVLLFFTSPLVSHSWGQTVYMNDFQGTVGSEWSSNTTEAPPADSTRQFLGRFADGTVSLSLSALPAHTSLSLDFDLFIMSSWDGDGPEPGTPDIWSLSVDGGPTLVHTTFSNFAGRTQDYPDGYDDVPDGAINPPKAGAVEVNTLGYPAFANFPGGDCVYHMHFDIPHTASSVMFSFVGGPGLTSVADESWGLDNVEIVASPSVLPQAPKHARLEDTRLVSIDYTGTAVGNGASGQASISGDGRLVVFSSEATNLLGPGLDTNGVADVFVRDLSAHQTIRISSPSAGGQADGPSRNPIISPNGRYVVFESLATNLSQAPLDTNGLSDVFWIDLQSSPLAPVLVSLTYNGGLSNGHSVQAVLSDDGAIVAFASEADNLTIDTPNTPGWDIFVRDLLAQSTVLASASCPGRIPGNTNQSEDQSISGDGRYVAFWSNAANPPLDPSDTNDDYDVYVFDRQTVCLSLVSVNLDDNTGPTSGSLDRASAYPSISRNGRYVAFYSQADDLVVNDTHAGPDVFVRDMIAGETRLVNLDWQGNVSATGSLVDIGSISSDGRFVTFYTGGSGYLPPGQDINGFWDVYLIDRDVDRDGVFDEPGGVLTQRVSVGRRGQEGNDHSRVDALDATLSGQGDRVVFNSMATNFTGAITDNNGASDVFVRELRPKVIRE